MLTFNEYLTESLRDKMTGKSEDDIRYSIEKMPVDKAIETCMKNGLNPMKYMTRKKMKSAVNSVDILKMLSDTIPWKVSTILKRFIRMGLDVNRKDDKGRTLLMDVSEKRNTEIAGILLENGADVNLQDNKGNTALFLSLSGLFYDHLPIVRLLVENGADVNLPSTEYIGWTPLMYAARSGEIEVVKFLIESGADMEVKDTMGRTALILTAGMDKKTTDKIVEVLLNAGADVNTVDDSGKNALDSTKKESTRELIKKYMNR